jgi:hypothetical protein
VLLKECNLRQGFYGKPLARVNMKALSDGFLQTGIVGDVDESVEEPDIVVRYLTRIEAVVAVIETMRSFFVVVVHGDREGHIPTI